jgi:hypothetical protein
MRLTIAWTIAGALCAATVVAQEPPVGPDSVRVERLRREVERRFAERVRVELALSDRQMEQLREHQRAFIDRRRELFLRQRDLRMALQGQMRPGVAADEDSVRRLNDALRENRGRLFALEQDEDAKLSEFLSPVQVAQYRQLRERFVERVNELRRRGSPLPGRPGQGPPRGPR